MATSKVEVTEGSGAKLATHSFTEDAATKHVSRVNMNDSSGADIFGSKTDDKSNATDTTPVSVVAILKRLSAALQVIESAILAEDAAHASADKGIQLLAKRASSPANTSGTDGDYEPLQVSAGRLWVTNTDLANFGAGEYETVAASQTDQALGATGATGDYLSGVLIVPATTSPGAVSIKDGSGSAITIFTGGASSVSNLVPFFVPLGLASGSGAWKITTGTNVSCIGCGNFT